MALPPGTVMWSAPGVGDGVNAILPAVPSQTGVADVFAVGSNTVQAITSDGTVAWTAPNVPVSNNNIVPDFQGGFVVVHQYSVQKYDGLTGQPKPAYTIPYSSTGVKGGKVLVHTDGTIFVVLDDSVVGIDPETGTAKSTVPMTRGRSSSVVSNCSYSYGNPGPPQDSPPQNPQPLLIAGDGYAYVGYSYETSTGTTACRNDSRVGIRDGLFSQLTIGHAELRAQVLRIGTDGSASEVTVGDWTWDGTTTTYKVSNPNAGTFPTFDYATTTMQSGETPPQASLRWGAITDADQGVLVTLGSYLTGRCAYQVQDPFTGTSSSGCPSFAALYPVNTMSLSTISAGALASQVTFPSGQLTALQPVLQGEDGTFYGTATFGSSPYQTVMTAFDSSGTIKWSVPDYSPVMLTADGHLTAQSTDGLTTATFDANGAAIGQLGELWTQSWTGHTYQLGSVAQVAVAPAELDRSFSPIRGANFSGNATAVLAKNPVVVGVEFDVEIKRWYALTQEEWNALIETTLTAMRAAYTGYAVDFSRAVAGKSYPRMIKVLNSQGPGVGATIGAFRFSDVHFPNLESTMKSLPELACRAPYLTECVETTGRSRSELLTALFKGAGNTGAHELGHQQGLKFLDRHAVNCLECYDNDTAEGSYAHFFGKLHWSEHAKTRMLEWLPPRVSGKP